MALANLLAPVAFVDHMTSPLHYIAPFAGSIDVGMSFSRHFFKVIDVILFSGSWNFWASANFFRVMLSWISLQACFVTKVLCKEFVKMLFSYFAALMRLKSIPLSWRLSCTIHLLEHPQIVLFTMLRKLIRVIFISNNHCTKGTIPK